MAAGRAGPEGGSEPPPWRPADQPRGPGASSQPPAYTVNAYSPMVLRRAAVRARELGHGSVRAAHLLLGLLADEDDPAARVLRGHGITLAGTRDAVAAKHAGAQDARPPEGAMPLARARRT